MNQACDPVTVSEYLVPKGTPLYVSRHNSYPIYLLPDSVYPRDTLYLAIDLRHQGVLVLPKGTPFTGHWLAEQRPEYSAQLQITTAMIYGREYDFPADSEVFLDRCYLNGSEVEMAPFMEEKLQVRKGALKRRIVRYRNRDHVLMDNYLDTTYLRVDTEQIQMRLIRDIVIPVANIPEQ